MINIPQTVPIGMCPACRQTIEGVPSISTKVVPDAQAEGYSGPPTAALATPHNTVEDDA